MTASCLYRGTVMHHRLEPKKQRFAYKVTSWLIDLDEIPELSAKLRLFSHNRFNLVSLFDRDLGGDRSQTPKQWILSLLAHHDVDLTGGRVLIHGFPRILGIGFSPLTTWFCYDRTGRLAAVQYEVHNTFGERHGYLALLVDRSSGRTLTHSADKLFHVSPFLDLSGLYRFALRQPDETFSLLIRELTEQGSQILIASHVAKRRSLTDAALVGLLPRLLALPFIVIGGIHWQALKLWIKGIGFRRKPAPPEMISLVTSIGDASS
jgi:DUF1365 family protein